MRLGLPPSKGCLSNRKVYPVLIAPSRDKLSQCLGFPFGIAPSKGCQTESHIAKVTFGIAPSRMPSSNRMSLVWDYPRPRDAKLICLGYPVMPNYWRSDCLHGLGLPRQGCQTGAQQSPFDAPSKGCQTTGMLEGGSLFGMPPSGMPNCIGRRFSLGLPRPRDAKLKKKVI